jgi:cadmium resistance transport/sequestration family protein
MLTLIVSIIVFFTATNIDDIFLLMTWFSQAKTTEQKLYIVAGQCFGFILLLALSLIGAFGALLIPQEWIGILGLVPIYIGIKSLLALSKDRKEKSNRLVWILKTATITVANGGDNISVYIPFFATNNLWNIIMIVVIFLALVTVWCYVGYLLVRQPLIAHTLQSKGHIIVPFVMIGLGIFILIKHETFHYIFTGLQYSFL